MSLRRAYIGCRVIETAENYARADTPLRTKPAERPEGGSGDYYYDGIFWERVLAGPEDAWGTLFRIDVAVLSEWIARVPGLYWKPESAQFRQLSPEAVEYKSQTWVTYSPKGKSRKVMGGIGTLRFPPGQDGRRLVSLTTTYNVSAGVPALVSPEVWDHHKLREGMLLGGRARWQPMVLGWSSYFPSTRELPRGYLIVDDPDTIEVHDPGHRAPTLIHPFTVMEYSRGAVELFDFVYAAADTGESRYRQRLERFFDSYKDRHERYGRYLLSGDMVSPLWDSQFDSPEDLRRADLSARSQLNILKARVRERHLGQEVIEGLLNALSTVCDSGDQLRLFSDQAGIPTSIWFVGGTVAELSNQLVDAALERDKVTALVEAVATHFPEQFQGE